MLRLKSFVTLKKGIFDKGLLYVTADCLQFFKYVIL